MNYSEDAIKFWRVMYRLFHGKALRFMGGLRKVEDQEACRGGYDPKISSLNFAVPSQKRITGLDALSVNLPKELPPGIINQALEIKSKEKTYILSCDGKKLAPGLSAEWGDQDLFGHEERDSLSTLKQRLKDEIENVEELRLIWNELTDDEKVARLQVIVEMVSLRIKDLRILFMKQELALKKFMKEGGQEWKTSKYVYAISSIQTQMYQIRNVVKKLLDINCGLLLIGSFVNKTHEIFSQSNEVDIFSQANLLTLKDVDDLPERMVSNIRFTKQRSPKWFEERKRFKLTGSTIFAGLGLDTLKLQQRHYDKVVRKLDFPEIITDDAKKRMDHGSASEIHAIATLTSKVLPFYYPNLVYVEEGAHVVCIDDSPCILVSPDGSLGQMMIDGSTQPVPAIACEFKCPSPAEYKTPVHYEIPVRYIPQILGEMACMNVKELVYLCWTKESSTVFRVSFDECLWEKILEESERVYFQKESKRPTRLSLESKSIQRSLKNFSNTNCEFLCEVPSAVGQMRGCSYSYDESPYVYPVSIDHSDDQLDDSVPDVDELFSNTVQCIRESYQVCRKKATEVLVWILADTDRMHDPEVPYSLPVAYGMKGYSLNTDIMRKMHDDVLRACQENNINVVCSCFDGQWAKLTTRDKNDKPLTLLQVQRDVYAEATKTTREAIVKKLSSHDIFTEEVLEITAYSRTKSGVKAVVSSDILRRVMKSLRAKIKGKKTVINEAATEADPIDTGSCLPDEALETLIDDENRSIFIAHSNPRLNTESTELEERDGFTNDDENEPVVDDLQDMKIENSKLETIHKNSKTIVRHTFL